MKSNLLKNNKLKGVRFNTWLIFSVFALIILILLWFLQLSLIKPYYRSAKINSVSKIADNIEEMLYENQPLTFIEQIARDNSLCIQIIDNNKNISEYNGIGSTCYIANRDFNYNEFYENIVESKNLEYNLVPDFDAEMIVFGRLIRPHLSSYTLLINAIVTPEKAGFVLIQNQFVILTIIVLALATAASFLISKVIADPFVKMTNSAKKLAQGDLDVSFNVENIYLNEFNDLSESLNFATATLKQIDQLRLDLLANVSHDIKTPLTMILAYSEMITDFSLDNKDLLLEHLEVIESEAKFLDNLVENMLELSTIESGNLVLNTSKFDLNALAKSIISHFNFDIILDFDGVYHVEADEIKIGQVIYNLINNAINHAKANKIIVKISKSHKNVRLSVIDDGVGIKAEELNNIWNRYFRIDKNFHREVSGSGLGLSISKGIILAHQGTIDVNSEEGKGSEFYFELLSV